MTTLPGSDEAFLVDSHCHLNSDHGGRTPEDLVHAASAAGVRWIVNVAVDRPSLKRVAETAARFPHVVCTAGIHPHEAVTLTEEDYEAITQAAAHPRCRAIGELGLDYYYNHSPHEIQKQGMERQIDIALETRLPIVVHTRDAEADQLESLKNYVARLPRSATGKLLHVPGVIHCFTGTEGFGQACLDLGFFISFSGILTFKNAEDLRRCAARFPLERLLVETDSPYLAPIPHRGKKGEPAFVVETARKLAEVRGESFEAIARATSANARELFQLS
jgi:TatD DNase family protein